MPLLPVNDSQVEKSSFHTAVAALGPQYPLTQNYYLRENNYFEIIIFEKYEFHA